MKKAVREHLEARGYFSNAAASQEGRIRQLVSDLSAILARRDGQALKQSAALARVPGTAPKPAPQPTSFVREVALGKTVVPELGNYTEREATLAHRAEMRERIGNQDAFSNPLFSEFAQENHAFEKEERTRWAAASTALKQGHAPGHVAAHFHLTEDEVENIQEQIGLKEAKHDRLSR